jgi:hypothetical protein
MGAGRKHRASKNERPILGKIGRSQLCPGGSPWSDLPLIVKPSAFSLTLSLVAFFLIEGIASIM